MVGTVQLHWHCVFGYLEMPGTTVHGFVKGCGADTIALQSTRTVLLLLGIVVPIAASQSL
jgi:hypothetical protein